MSKKDSVDVDYFLLMERTVKQFRKFSQRELSKRNYDISEEQWNVLKSVNENPGITQKEVAEKTFKDPASITRMIDLMVERGFLERKASAHDRRSFSIHLTDEGRSFITEVLPITDEMRKFGLKNVSEEDKKVFIGVLNKLFFNLE